MPKVIIKFKKQNLDEYLKLNKLSRSRFCKLCGISPQTLRKFESGKSLRIKTLAKLIYFTKKPLDFFIDHTVID